jgi:hypothetical protein
LPDGDRPPIMPSMTPLPFPTPSAITLRAAFPDDRAAVRELAALDSAPPPAEPLLLAFEGDALRAALSLSTRAAVADPFAPTSHLVALLHRAAARRTAPPRWSSRPRLVLRTG